MEGFLEFVELRVGSDGEVEVLGAEGEFGGLICEDGRVEAVEPAGEVVEFVLEPHGVEDGGGVGFAFGEFRDFAVYFEKGPDGEAYEEKHHNRRYHNDGAAREGGVGGFFFR